MRKTTIEVTYPNGEVDRQNHATDTYRKVIEFLGLENVRNCNIFYNGINIVSKKSEMKANQARKNDLRKVGSPRIENYAINNLGKDSDLGICTEFNNKTKVSIINRLNENLNAGVSARLIIIREI